MIAQTWRLRFAALLLVASTACFHNKNGEQDDQYYRRDPIPVRVKNENFLDVNVFVVTDTQRRRLGTVTGNTQANFAIEWSLVADGPFSLVAVPIGGFGQASSGSLSVGLSEAVEFRVAPVLRQSTAVVYEP